MRLPLFPQAPQCEAGWEEPEPLNHACTKCEMHEGVRCVALSPEGKPGGLYVIGEYPDVTDDQTGRPFTGASGKFVRSLIAKLWSGPVAYDNAIRCKPGRRKLKDKHADACRAYTAQVLREVRPQRIVALGGWGAYSLLNRKPQVLSLRRGYSWWIDEVTYPSPDSYVPVYFAINPVMALRNRFLAKQFEEDLTWALTAPVPEAKHVKAMTWDVRDATDATTAEAVLRNSEYVTFDVETSGVMYDNDFRVECLTLFAAHSFNGYTWDRPALEDAATRVPLLRLLADDSVKKAGHGLTFDTQAVWADPLLNVDTTRAMHIDTRLFRKLLEGEVTAKLEVAAEVIGMGGHKEEAQEVLRVVKHDLAKMASMPYVQPNLTLTKTGKARKPPKPYVPKIVDGADVSSESLDKIYEERAETIQYAYRYVPTDVRTRYNARDALATSMLVDELEPRLRVQPNLVRVWEKVTLPAMRALARMERHGILADKVSIHAFDQHMTMEIDAIQARLKAYGDINFDSPKQLAELLYVKLGLPVLKRTAPPASQPSTDKETMLLLEEKTGHPITKDIVEFSHLTTIRGTFARGLLARVRDDGRLHTHFLLDGAGTGRTSSNDPNLQNIPSPDNDPILGKMSRDCFIARPGYLLIECDYSQLELRIAAMLSQDPVMIAMFRAGHDFHEATAKMVALVAWGVSDWDALTPELKKQYRRFAKTLNFQINYDLEPAFKLAKTLDIKPSESEKFVALVMGKFDLLRRAIKNSVAAAKRHGATVVYLDGEIANVRQLPALGESYDSSKQSRDLSDDERSNRARVRNAMNAIWNTAVQGTAAHFATRSLEPVQLEFDREGLDAHLALEVHDSLVAEVRADQALEAKDIMCQVMSSWPSNGVPIVVDAKMGRSWGSLQKC